MQQGKVDKSNEKCHNCPSQLHPTTSTTSAHKLFFRQSISIIIKMVRSSIFVRDVVHTSECFPDKLPIFTGRRHHNYLLNKFPSNIYYSIASLKALESLSGEWNCVLLALFSSWAYEPARILLNIIMSAYSIVQKYEIELLLSAINARKRQCFHKTFHFPFTVHSERKIHPINEGKTVLIESRAPSKPNTRVITR